MPKDFKPPPGPMGDSAKTGGASAKAPAPDKKSTAG